MTIEALIFDLDGTMADTEEAHRLAFNLAFERHRLGWRWTREAYRGLLSVHGGKERLAAYIDALDTDATQRERLHELIPAIHAEKTKFYSSFAKDGAIPLRSGVARLIDEALSAGARVGVASSTTEINVEALLCAALGERALDKFAAIACGDAVDAKKPAPDIYRLVLRQLGVKAERAVAIEDTPNGVRAATAAGLWTVATPTFWSEGGDFSAAGLALPDLGDATHPLEGEPGDQLLVAPWLTFREISARAGSRGATVHGQRT
jgi:beta-phosphoglucomutase-like phosphatase (HAD superfamily)